MAETQFVKKLVVEIETKAASPLGWLTLDWLQANLALAAKDGVSSLEVRQHEHLPTEKDICARLEAVEGRVRALSEREE